MATLNIKSVDEKSAESTGDVMSANGPPLLPGFGGKDHLPQFQSDGFTVFPEFLTPCHLAEVREAFDQRMQCKLGDEVDLGCNWSDATAAPFLQIILQDSFLDLAAAICGLPFVALRLELFGKIPGRGTAIPWHQDTFTTHVDFKWTNDKAADPGGKHPFTLWVALDDVSLVNGGMEMIPGRHREILGGAVPEEEIQDDRRVEYRMLAGQAGIHHPLTPHRSCVNQTSSGRRAFLVRFAPWTDKIQDLCGSPDDVKLGLSSIGWLSSPSEHYMWRPGSSETLAEGYRLNRLLVCTSSP